jgi:hypothetical protein
MTGFLLDLGELPFKRKQVTIAYLYSGCQLDEVQLRCVKPRHSKKNKKADS